MGPDPARPMRSFAALTGAHFFEVRYLPKPLATHEALSHPRHLMGLPTEPVTLTPEQVAELNQKLSAMRHDINNHLSLMMAAVEMIRLKPEDAARRLATLAEQPARISRAMAEFSAAFEKALGITR
jgi:hypothetical protein